jgi:hypothetical protein
MNIVELAKQAHGPITGEWWDMDVASLERFAALVAAHEREACAKLCEDAPEPDGADLAERIRAGRQA